MMEEFKSMPFPAVWDMLCEKDGVPVGMDWITEMEKYESDVLVKRQ
jgi:L-rhamnose isomerase